MIIEGDFLKNKILAPFGNGGYEGMTIDVTPLYIPLVYLDNKEVKNDKRGHGGAGVTTNNKKLFMRGTYRAYHQGGFNYAKWLEESEWDYFATFTTRYILTLEGARRLMERYFTELKKRFGSVRLFWIAERFTEKEGYHVHALIYTEQRASKEWLDKIFQTVSAAHKLRLFFITQFLTYDKFKGASYLTKNIMNKKTGWDILNT